jgi:Intron-binding protein aquarius N-terminus
MLVSRKSSVRSSTHCPVAQAHTHASDCPDCANICTHLVCLHHTPTLQQQLQVPSEVRADLQYSVGAFNPLIRSEWDSLREHDVVFLVAVQGPPQGLSAEALSKLPFMKRYGITAVRGGTVSCCYMLCTICYAVIVLASMLMPKLCFASLHSVRKFEYTPCSCAARAVSSALIANTARACELSRR